MRFLGAARPRAGAARNLADIAASGTRAGEVIRRLRAMLKKEETERSRSTSTS
jgi:hypothetical protein